MIDSDEADSRDAPDDPVVAALTNLSEVATSSADNLMGLNEDIATLHSRRRRGWSWNRIISDADSPNPLAALTAIATNFARASGGFRRALALGLRKEGMQVTEIASLFGVSRQRVSALIRPRPQDENEEMDEQLDEQLIE
jgi:predicted XRE-type DNA-binding protein